VGRNVEFALHPQHETFSDLERRLVEDFNQETNRIPRERHWHKVVTKTFSLQGHCIVYVFKLLCTFIPLVIASHN